MKKCKFCGALNANKATKCSSCGANEFVYQCENCGAEFESGKFCPNCGTKIGQVAKKCPNCGNEYYTNACPSCGYVPGKATNGGVEHRVVVETVVQNKPKKKVTFGTVLLWIFFLPIMATISIWRSSWTTKRKIIVTAVMWIIFLAIGAANKESTATPTSPPTSIEQSNKAETVVEEPAPTEEPEPVLYEEDEVVNQFLTNYNAISNSPFEDLSRGNIRQKVHGHSYGYWCTLLHAADTNKILVTIDETDDNASVGVSGMRDVFRDVVVSIDPSLSDEEIYAYFDKMMELGGFKEEGPILGNTEISYSPDVDLSWGRSRGYIKVGEIAG